MTTGRRRITRTTKHRDLYAALAVAVASFTLVAVLEEPPLPDPLPVIDNDRRDDKQPVYGYWHRDSRCIEVLKNAETAPVQYSWC